MLLTSPTPQIVQNVGSTAVSIESIFTIVGWIVTIGGGIFFIIKLTTQANQFAGNLTRMDEKVADSIKTLRASFKSASRRLTRAWEMNHRRLNSHNRRISDLERFLHKKCDFQPRDYAEDLEPEKEVVSEEVEEE